MVTIHKKVKICFLCGKKISNFWSRLDWDYYDYDLGEKIIKNGIDYRLVDRYWHTSCEWKNRPVPPYEE